MAVNGVSVLAWDGPATPAQDVRAGLAALLANGTGRPLGARCGSRPGSTPCTVSGTTVTVPPRTVVIDSAATNTQSPYEVAWTQAQTVALDPAPSSNSRIDAVYVRLYDNIFDASNQQQVTFGKVTGTAGSTPQRPTQLPDGTSLSKVCVLAWVTVPSSGGATVKPGPETAAAGGIPRLNDATEESAWADEDGAFAYRRDTNNLRVNHGSGWTDYDHARVRGVISLKGDGIPPGGAGYTNTAQAVLDSTGATFAVAGAGGSVKGRGTYLARAMCAWDQVTTARAFFELRQNSTGERLDRKIVTSDDRGAVMAEFTIDSETGVDGVTVYGFHSNAGNLNQSGTLTITRIGG